jgi:FkbM family methyltransferase
MSIKNNFESFCSKHNIVLPHEIISMPNTEFGNIFFEFARSNGYDIANTCNLVLDHLDIGIEEIVDVGVHDGTPWLYKRFPEARFVLVEPQKNPETRLRHKPGNYIMINSAVGNKEGLLYLTEGNERSSLLNRQDELTEQKSKLRYEVPIVTLDHVINKHCKTDRIGIKLDIEGFEYFAIEGINSELKKVQFIILEVSIRNRFEGEKNFGEICALLMQKGFRFYNIMNTARPSPPNAYDIIFLPIKSTYFSLAHR